MTIQKTALIGAAKIGNAFLAAFGCVCLQKKEKKKRFFFKCPFRKTPKNILFPKANKNKKKIRNLTFRAI